MASERPAKRVRQACEPCRRKKSKCPGEKPVCSHCSRLSQNCFYAEERQQIDRAFRSISPTPQRTSASLNDSRLDDRLRNVEAQLAEVLASQASVGRGTPYQPPDSQAPPRAQRAPIHLDASLPPWEVVLGAAETYLLYCDCQPLPLFHRPTFIRTLSQRKPEVLLSILAITLRFVDGAGSPRRQARDTSGYVEAARAIVSRNIFEGTIELSTIQSLCLLSLVDFTDGNTRRASIHCSTAMSLAHNAGLTSETQEALSDCGREERRRCFWSLFLLKRLHGADFMILDFAAEDNFPWYPETTGNSLNPTSSTMTPSISASCNETLPDKGIVAYGIQLSEVWFKTTRYWKRGKPSKLPPWSHQSDYSIIITQQMEFETRMPYYHRFEPAKFSQKSVEELNANRDYWGPWLFIQFLYHTNLCLLNHPLLTSLRLRHFKCVIPEIFLQHTSDLVSSHTSWIINYIDMLEAKPFKVTDPFLGHCVAIVATIYLQESFVDDAVTRRQKQDCFEKCLRFIRGFGDQWPHVNRIASKLQRLSETVSSTYVASDTPIRQSRKLLIDLGQFFEILEYSSSSELPGSAKRPFGPSLQSSRASSRSEIAQTSVLPKPTRVEKQEFGSATPTPRMQQVEGRGFHNVVGPGPASVEAMPAPLAFSDDELAVLAENFFHQRQEFGGNANWWNVENV